MAPFANVRIEVADALRVNWSSLLAGDGWKMASNLPYNVAVPLLVEMLERVPQIGSYVVMVQREVGERLVAGPGEEAYGAVSVKVAYLADARVLRRVPAAVFWPEPKVESVLVGLAPRPATVDVDRVALFRVVERGFAERRKTIASALRRMGLDRSKATGLLRSRGVDPMARAEDLGLPQFAAVAEALLEEGLIEAGQP